MVCPQQIMKMLAEAFATVLFGGQDMQVAALVDC